MASFSKSGLTPVKACSLSGTGFIVDLEHNSGKARGLDDLAKTIKTLSISRLLIGGCAGLTRQEVPMIEMVGLNFLALHLQHLARVVRPTMIVPVAASESSVPVSVVN